MSVSVSTTNKPLNPRAQDLSPKGYNRAALYSGKALDFDGVNDVVTTGQDLGNLQTLSIAMRCRIDNMTDGTARGVVSQWDGSDGWMIYKSGGSSVLTFWKNGNAVFSWDDSVSYSDQWIDLVYIIEQGVGNYIYVNGVLVGSDTTNIADIDYTNNPTFKVGAYANTSAGFLNGAVGGVKIFNTALTAAQVADLYLNPEKIVPDGVASSALKLWLPMQEGAGTTAYDGSGNGNHGTINGATWVSGIGAPVAQTALVSWNKGTNKLVNSTDLDTYWTFSETSVDSGYLAPDGSNTAFKITKNSGATSPYGVKGAVVEADDYRGIWARTTSGTGQLHLLTHSSNTNNLFTITEEWQKFSIDSVTSTTGETSFYLVDFRGSSSLTEIVLWQPHCAESESVLVPTIGSAQTSPVLLPQGLTANKDITGVNAFESARNPYALNLDGASWAEVHDNASLDITSAITLECWFYDTDSGAFEGVIGKWKDATDRTYAIIKNNGSNNFLLRISTDGSAQAGPTITNTNYGWIHLVLTYDGANVKGYKNGVYQSQAALTGSIATNDLPVEIGRYGQSTGSQYDNQLALPRIYNRALTATEVLRNYNADRSKFGL